jgi:hypothetical protein
VIATASAADRTNDALARYVAASHREDVNLVQGFVTGDDSLNYRAVERLPQVATWSRVGQLAVLVRSRSGRPLFVDSGGVSIQMDRDARYGATVNHWRLLAGRRPDPNRPEEALADSKALHLLGLKVGDTLVFRVVGYERLWRSHGFLNTAGDPIASRVGPLARVRIVGETVRDESNEVFGLVFLTPAFYREHSPNTLGAWTDQLIVRLKGGGADLPAFRAEVDRIAGRHPFGFLPAGDDDAKVQDAIHLQAEVLWLVAGLGGLAVLLLLGQALSRRAVSEAADHETLRGVGMTRPQLFALGFGPSAAIALAAAGLAVVVAVGLSPIGLLGRARQLEPASGISADGRVLAAGAGILLIGLLAAGALVAWRTAGRRRPTPEMRDFGERRRRGAVGVLTRAGGSPPLLAGVGAALGRGGWRSALPMRQAMLGVALAVALVAAALTVSASLRHLLDTPRLYGQNWDYEIPAGGPDLGKAFIARLRGDPLIGAASVYNLATPVIGGKVVETTGLGRVKGTLGPTVISGRAPMGPNEILLGPKTLDALGDHVGDIVDVRQGRLSERLRIVGRGIVPEGLENRLGEGAVVTFSALRRIVPSATRSGVYIRVAPGVDRSRALLHYEKLFSTDPAIRPVDVGNFGGITGVPAAVAILFAVAAAAALVHALLVSIRRRRRELAILKTLGFTGRQVAASLAWQTTTVAAVGLLVGLPIGILAGRWGWNRFANQLGVVPEPLTPAVLLLLAIPGTLLVANLVGAVPAGIAARTRPAQVLRAE